MLVRRLCHALISTTVVAGAIVLSAAPSHADDSCSTATPFRGNTGGTVGGADDNDYLAYEVTLPGTYRFTIQHPAGTSATMWVQDSGCTGALCSESQASSPASCDALVPAPTTLKIRVFSFSSTDVSYTVSVDYRTLPTLPTQCADEVDNNGDGWTDLADSGCSGPFDTSEGTATSCPAPGGAVTCVGLTPGEELTRVNVYGPDVQDVTVVGSIDLYQFTLPGNTKVNVPCVVLQGMANPCADLGGTFFARMVTLAPVSVPMVDPLIDEPITSIALCKATLQATVNDIGVQSLGAVAVC